MSRTDGTAALRQAGQHPERNIAGEWYARAADLADWTERQLVNRTDAFGHYRPLAGRAEGGEKAFCDKSTLTRAVLVRHYRGRDVGDLVGPYSTVFAKATGEGEVSASLSRWLVIDVDRHDDQTDPQKTYAAALAVFNRARDLGLCSLLVDSNGRGGFHVYVIFGRSEYTEKVFALGRFLTRDWKTLGLEAQPETFPKQASIRDGEYGNFIRLPGRHHTHEHWSRVWDGIGWAEGHAAIDLILGAEGTPIDAAPPEAIRPAPKPAPLPKPRDWSRDSARDAELASKALDYLEPSCGYEEWLEIGMALTPLGMDGLRLWDAWSSGSDKYREGLCAVKWRSFRRGGRTLGTLFHKAKERGFEFPSEPVVIVGSSKPNLRVVTEDEPPGPTEDGEGPCLAKSRPRTDLGNAERMVGLFGDRFRYCHPWKKALVWDGKRWKIDDTGASRRLAKKTVRSIYGEAKREADEDARKQLVAFALASEKKQRIDALHDLAMSEPGIPVLPSQLDRDPWLLNCRNCTIDLRTGKGRPHDKADLLTKLAPVDYDPEARCPLFEETLKTFLVHADLIAFWQRLCGMAITGVIRDHVLPIAYGTGSNGKSTLLNILLETLGLDYAMKAPPDLLVAKQNESHPTDRADLFGKRIVLAIETEDGQRLNESQVKELTGGDRVRARRMREDFWEFEPTHTIFLATNHKPQVRGSDNGIWRRLKLVPFNVQMATDKAKTDVPERLKEERAGILAWLVRGCMAWQEIGLNPPDVVTSATDEYRKDEDTLGQFISDRCQLNPNATVKLSRLYGAYKAWCEESNFAILNQKRFGRALGERGLKSRSSNGTWYDGITLNQEDELRF